MKTPMQELLEWVRATLPMDLDTPQIIEQKIESLIEKEKEQRMEAWCNGYDSCDEDISGDSPLEYYYLTFENKNE
jgi:hypothetical protein